MAAADLNCALSADRANLCHVNVCVPVNILLLTSSFPGIWFPAKVWISRTWVAINFSGILFCQATFFLVIVTLLSSNCSWENNFIVYFFFPPKALLVPRWLIYCLIQFMGIIFADMKLKKGHDCGVKSIKNQWFFSPLYRALLCSLLGCIALHVHCFHVPV